MKLAVKKQNYSTANDINQHLEHTAVNPLPHLVMLPQRVNQERPVLAAILGSPRAVFGAQGPYVTAIFREGEA